MGPSHMVSMGFVETTDRYAGAVTECIREGGRWLLLVRAGAADYVFASDEEWRIGDPATVSVVTAGDGSRTETVARPV